MKYADLPEWSLRAGDWAKSYHETLSERPVRARTVPGDVLAALPEAAPEQPESMEQIFEDFKALVPAAMTHWQHPRFFAYFSANASPASIIAEHLVNSMGCNALLWETSPAATEFEVRMGDWMRQAIGLPDIFHAVIHDTATTATLCAVITMRERILGRDGLMEGLFGQQPLRIYASRDNHSSVDKAVRLSGIGQNNLVRPHLDARRSLDPDALSDAIASDLARGFRPAGLVLCCGGTATGACDRIAENIAVAREHGLYVHLDAAWAGSAMICPEFRDIWDGCAHADSIVVNPHKWLGAQLDCSLQFLRDPDEQAATLGLRPDYLRSDDKGSMRNYSEMTIALGRRFRALKLWFVLRAHGLCGLQEMIRNHCAWIRQVEAMFEADPDFEIVTTSPFALFGFRLAVDPAMRDALTAELCRRINDDGHVYLTHATCDGAGMIRVTAGTFACTREDVLSVYSKAKEIALDLNCS